MVIFRISQNYCIEPYFIGNLRFCKYVGFDLVGASLLLGLFSRYSALVGMGFVILYYLFAPPFLGLEYARPGEGSYIIVNKNLIEACALWVIYTFPTGQIIGLDRLLTKSISS